MQKERLSHTISAVIYSLSLVSDFHLRMKHFIVHTIFLDLSGRLLRRNRPHKPTQTRLNRFLGRCENTDGAHIFIQQVTLTENDANDEADGFIIKITTVSHGGGGGPHFPNGDRFVQLSIVRRSALLSLTGREAFCPR